MIMSLFVKVFSFLIPIIMIIMGIKMWFLPVRTINPHHGYHSRKSMLSQDAWDYAQACMGKTWTLVGIALIFVTIFLLPRIALSDINTLITILSIQIVFLFLPMAWVEIALGRFDQ